MSVTLLDGRIVDSSSQAYMLECEASFVLAMDYPERAAFFDGVLKKRKISGLEALKQRCFELEPAYVLALPTIEERRAYLMRVGRQFGGQVMVALEAKVMTLHKARKLANTSGNSA